MSIGNNIRASEVVAEVMASIPKPPEPTPRELELEQQLEQIMTLLDDDDAENPLHAVKRALRETDAARREVTMLRARDRVARGTRLLAEAERVSWHEYAKHALAAEILRQGEQVDELAAQRTAARHADNMLELEARRFDDIPDDLVVLDKNRDQLKRARETTEEP